MPTGTAANRKQKPASAGEEVERLEPWCTVGGTGRRRSHRGKQCGSPLPAWPLPPTLPPGASDLKSQAWSRPCTFQQSWRCPQDDVQTPSLAFRAGSLTTAPSSSLTDLRAPNTLGFSPPASRQSVPTLTTEPECEPTLLHCCSFFLQCSSFRACARPQLLKTRLGSPPSPSPRLPRAGPAPSPVLPSRHPVPSPSHRALLLALYSSVSLPRPGALEGQASVSSVIILLWPRMGTGLSHCHTVVPGGS